MGTIFFDLTVRGRYAFAGRASESRIMICGALGVRAYVMVGSGVPARSS